MEDLSDNFCNTEYEKLLDEPANRFADCLRNNVLNKTGENELLTGAHHHQLVVSCFEVNFQIMHYLMSEILTTLAI